jgi:hypothetical protein
MIEISAFIAQEHISSYSILFTHMIAFRTSPARVSSGYRLRFHSGQRRLVLDISSQLRKCPLTHAISLLLPEPCPVSDAFKVFGCVCRINFTAWDTSIGGRFYQLFFYLKPALTLCSSMGQALQLTYGLDRFATDLSLLAWPHCSAFLSPP